MKCTVAAMVAVLLCGAVSSAHPKETTVAPTGGSLRVTTAPLAAKPRNDIPGLPNFARISDTLYRGAQPTARGFSELRRMGVRTVLNLRAFHSDRDLLTSTGLRYISVRCEAWDPDSREAAVILRVLRDPANHPVFVHCQAGADRTGWAVALYRIMVEGWPPEQAVAEMDNFGHHKVFGSIKRFLRGFDRDALEKRADTVPMPGIDVIH